MGGELGALQELFGKECTENPLVVFGTVEVAVANAYGGLSCKFQLAVDAGKVLLLPLFQGQCVFDLGQGFENCLAVIMKPFCGDCLATLDFGTASAAISHTSAKLKIQG